MEGDMHGVDGISGGTITSVGVSDMLLERLNMYLPFFNKMKSSLVVDFISTEMDSLVTINDSIIN